MIAHVVPILRLRRATTWWSYRIPSSTHCEVGSLVVIPFRNRQELGVVWEIEKDDAHAEESLTKVITQSPLLRVPHRQTVEWLSEAGFTSLSTALYLWLPTALRRFPLTPTTQKILTASFESTLTALDMATRKQQLVLLPSRRPESTASLQKKYGDVIQELFDSNNPHQELQDWLAILHGERTVIIGREQAVTAPFLNLNHVLIQEPEDIAYYHEQIPYLSYQEAAQKVGANFKAQVTIKSHVPHAAAILLWGEHALGSTLHAPVTLIDLSRDELLNETLLDALRNLEPGKKALLLYNAHDRLVAGDDNLKKLLPGIETLRKNLATKLGYATLPPHIILDTRSMFSSLHQNVGFTAILSLDPLLHTTSFADQVHGWSDIGRLTTYAAPCLIQARNQHHPLTEALRNALFEEYCVKEITVRKDNHLPPFATTVVCSLPESETGQEAAEKVHTKLTNLFDTHTAPWVISHPFQGVRRKKTYIHILLYSSDTDRLPAPIAAYLKGLSRPWKIQRNPWFVL
jgi:primosomal protein N'